jgi:hypothetical protein
MGQRANILTIAEGARQLYYSHWCANTMFRDLFWGSQAAISFASRQRRVDPDDWLDSVWAEGGAVIDADSKVLLFFGGDDELVDIPLRRVMLELLEYAWRPWRVRWAFRGIADLVEYAGHESKAVLVAPRSAEPIESLAISQEQGWTTTIGSLRCSSGEVRLFPLPGALDDYLRSGESLVAAAEVEAGLQHLDLTMAGCDFPTGAFHIDAGARRVDYWRADDDPHGGELIALAWPGWHVQWHLDSYELHATLLDGRVIWPPVELHVILDRARQILLGKFEQQGPVLIAEVQREAEAKGESLCVNPFAREAPPQVVSFDERCILLDSAVAEFCQKHRC